MDLFVLLKSALILFSGTILLFLFGSFFLYKIRKFPQKIAVQEPIRIDPFNRYTRENTVHSVALAEPQNIVFIQNPAPSELKKTATKVPTIIPHQTRFQVVNTPRKGDVLLQFNYNSKLYR